MTQPNSHDNGHGARRLCLHCGLRPATKPSGWWKDSQGGLHPYVPRLCRYCWADRNTRRQYRLRPQCADRGVGLEYRGHQPYANRTEEERQEVRLALEPCPHPPGSEGRIQTLERRARLGLALFQPGDRTRPDFEEMADNFMEGYKKRLRRDGGGGEPLTFDVDED